MPVPHHPQGEVCIGLNALLLSCSEQLGGMEVEPKGHCQTVQEMVDMKFLLKAISVNQVLQVSIEYLGEIWLN